MPLSELLYRMAKGEIDSSQEKYPSSFPPANDVVELVWENGQVHTCRGRKIDTCSNFSSHSSKIRGRDMTSGTNSKLVKFGLMDPVLPQVPMPAEMGLDHYQDDDDDDMVPWLNYPIDEYLQYDSCPELSPELSGVTVNENSSQNNFVSSSYRSNGDRFLEIQDGLGLVQEKFCSIEDGDAARHRTGAGQLYASQSQQCHTSFPCFRSRISTNAGDNAHGATATHHAISEDSTRILTSRGGFPATKMQNHVAWASTSNPLFMNCLHLSRPPAIDKDNVETIGARTSSGISSMERIGTKDRSSISNTNNPVESSLIDSCSGTKSHCHPLVSSKLEPKSVDIRLAKEPVPAELPKAVSRGDDSMNDKNCCETFGESGTTGMEDDEKNVEPVVACSVCSGNNVERASEDLKQNLKRKHQDTEESVGPSEDVEEESVGAKKAAPTRGTGTKRSRAAEVHNLSERRRRDRINEKMRALQELIPNCNKVDKASMLDEAIEYLKTLQLQVQIMSMGAGLYMPSMMLPLGMPRMHAAHMARFSNMGVGMGMGFGNGGPSGCSMLPVPPMAGAHFPAPSPMNGLGFGISDQGLPMPYARPPLMPMSGGSILNATMGMNARGLVGPLDHLDSAPFFIPNTNSQTPTPR